MVVRTSGPMVWWPREAKLLLPAATGTVKALIDELFAHRAPAADETG